MLKLLSSLTRTAVSRSITANGLPSTNARNFHYTPVLYAEPLKKKKKVDPAVVKAREDRRRKKLEKAIRRLEKNERQLKPIEELEVPLSLIDEKELRSRKLAQLPEQELERRALLMKKWAHYRLQENMNDFRILEKVMTAQAKALKELRLESEELYQQAVQPDMDMIPFTAFGPVQTPPIKDYNYIDGDYSDISKKYEGENK